MKRKERKNEEKEKDQPLDIKWISEKIVINAKIRTLEVPAVVFLIGCLLQINGAQKYSDKKNKLKKIQIMEL